MCRHKDAQTIILNKKSKLQNSLYSMSALGKLSF